MSPLSDAYTNGTITFPKVDEAVDTQLVRIVTTDNLPQITLAPGLNTTFDTSGNIIVTNFSETSRALTFRYVSSLTQWIRFD